MTGILLAITLPILAAALLALRRSRARLGTSMTRQAEIAEREAAWTRATGDGLWELDAARQRLRFTLPGESLDGPLVRELAWNELRRDWVLSDDLEIVDRALAAVIAGNAELDCSYRARYGSRTERIRVRGQRLAAPIGALPRYAGSYRVVTRSVALRQRLEFLDAVLHNTSDGVIATDASRLICYANTAAIELIGIPRDELLGATLERIALEPADGGLPLQRSIVDGRAWNGELDLRQPSGVRLTVHWRSQSVSSAGEYRQVHVFNDVTARRRAESNLKFLSGHDPLTGLPNRRTLLARLEDAIQRQSLATDTVALVYIDLDRFKHINDALGHQVGDELLKRSGERMAEVAGSRDRVARLGGDEFAVLVEGEQACERAELLAARLLDAFQQSLGPRGTDIVLTPSIGLSRHPLHGRSAEALLRSADAAMYAAKEAGRNTWSWYTQAIAERTTERARLESALRRALERGEVYLVYQPKQELATRRLTGVEALLRWRHPELGLVPADKFIPLAEELGLIVELGEWVLYQAARQLIAWQAAGLDDMTMAINLSALQLQRSSPAAFLQSMIAHLGIRPELLSIELTESRLLVDPDRSIRLLHELREVGVGLAIDDFGTGYSSLDYLRRLPVDTIKIDRSFINGIEHDRDGAVLASTIIMMGRSLRLRTVAEGVETEGQLRALADFGCDEIQGYVLSPPLEPERLQAFWLRHQPRRRLRVVEGGAGHG
ncbi:MAG: EAL domain-containing protein [Xanthomonadales bacterium]|jgi:diguanylate cyclase (GGDEF)-like protein/PAS domain S-box-containing protein|nr:EAL domain-containing protein [Xanthomonadales bacterium]